MEPELRADPVPCRHLRCKGMYVKGTSAPPSEYAGDTTSWWCALSFYAVGPDSDWVHRSACLPGRACYEARPGAQENPA